MVWVAAAGPAMNIGLAILAALAFHLVGYLPVTAAEWAAQNLKNALIINVVLAVLTTDQSSAVELAHHRRARSRSIAPGSSPRKRSTSSSVVFRSTATRTLAWVSAPIAASTWLGSRVEDVQADPLATSNPAGQARSPGPRRRRRGRRG